jgi:CBS domain-containing protein
LPPADVTGFAINIVGTSAYLTWDAVPDLDLSHYVIRHSRATTGATYAKATDLLTKVPRPAVSAVAPAMTGTYFIKAVDKSGYESANSTEIVALIENIKDVMFTSKLYDRILVKELLVHPNVFATSNESMDSILKKLDQNDFWFLPVIDHLKFQGFISRNKIFSNYREKLKETIIE